MSNEINRKVKYYCPNKYCVLRNKKTEVCKIYDDQPDNFCNNIRLRTFANCEFRKKYIKEFCPTEDQCKNIITVEISETNEDMPF